MRKDNQSFWLVMMQAGDDHSYNEGKFYVYSSNIPNGQRIKPGDFLIIASAGHDSNGERIIGIVKIGTIRIDGLNRLKAFCERSKSIKPALTFDEVGGDPRNNSNSILKIDKAFAEKILAKIGVASADDLPSVDVGTEQIEIPPPVEIRDELHKTVILDLLGPANGPNEEVVGTSVRDRYLVGKLAPRRVIADAAATEDRNRGGGAATEDDSADDGEPAHESLMPSSFGMTFCVDGSVKELIVSVSWGRYERGDSKFLIETEEKPKKAWHRFPAGGRIVLSLNPGAFGPLIPDERFGDVFVRGSVRNYGKGNDHIVTLFLVNGQEEPEQNKDANWLFQPEVSVTTEEEAPVFMRRPTEKDLFTDDERGSLSMLYRKQAEFAVGHGVSIHAKPHESHMDRAVEVKTTIIPFYDVPKTEVPTPDDISGIKEVVLDMKSLCELESPTLISSLKRLCREYETWIAHQRTGSTVPDLVPYVKYVENALSSCERTKERLAAGVDVLEKNPIALDAFRFMNKAMWHQRVRGVYAQMRRRGEATDLEALDIPSNRSWYPFQLAFILLIIPSIFDPEHPDRTEQGNACADLLWFPTGGGKTEAYLGLAAFTMVVRRLKRDMGNLDSERGVAVLMRYTLRLLTIQQFQRASTLLCAMEIIRRTDPTKWGRTPFRLGLWVGAKATPNTTKDAADAISNAHGDRFINRGTGNPQQLTNCPWCGSEIKMGRDLECLPFNGNIGRTLTYCSEPLGQCDFSRAKSPNEGIPVVVVDEEIYRLLPAMLIGTVDKFAQMPWRGEVQTLFGRVSGECERHGFISPDAEEDCRGNHNARGRLPRVERKACRNLRPPDLIIQDEFHLISGPLGTMVGLYETAIDELSSWRANDKKIYPKIIASTATIRKAVEQAHHVFLRRVEIFPPHGIDINDNFFSIRRPVSAMHPGRRYLGICAPGMSRPAVQIRVYTTFLTAAQRLYDLYGEAADPWMTLIGYFNSLRELGGMRRLVEDDVRTRSFRITLGDLERYGMSQRDVRGIRELTSRASSADIPLVLDQLEEKFSPSRDPAKRPIDVVLATNMISVGVDVQRLGLMITNGQPKTTAEYIQATSRVGRRYPGLVCTVLNWSRPRDLSHYETFENYHATFYQHVEAQSVTPFAPRAIDRGLTGVLASLIRLEAADLNQNGGAGRLIDTQHFLAQMAKDLISARAGNVTQQNYVRDFVERSLMERIDHWVNEATQGGRNLGYKAKRDASTVGLLSQPGSNEWTRFTTPTSMREVEPNVALILRPEFSLGQKEWSAPQPRQENDKQHG